MRDFVLSVAARGGTAALALVLSVVVARTLGPDGQGYFFFAITFSATIVQLGHLGLHSSITYQVAGNPAVAGRVLANGIWISGVGGVVISAAAVVGVGLWSGVPWTYLLLGAGMVPARLLLLFGGSVLLATGRLLAYNVLTLANSVLLLAPVVVAGALKVSVSGFLLATLGGWLLSAAATLWSTRDLLKTGLRFDAGSFRQGLGYAARAYAACILAFLVVRGNVFVLQHLAGVREVGFYSIAAQCGDAIALIPVTVATVLFPELVRNEAARFKNTVDAALRMGLLTAGLCLLCAALARPLVTHVFGERYLPVVPILWWSLPGVFFFAMTSLLSQYLASVGIPKALLAAWAVAVLLLFALGALWIPAHGGRGAALALSTAYAAVLGSVLWIIRRLHRDRGQALPPVDMGSGGASRG